MKENMKKSKYEFTLPKTDLHFCGYCCADCDYFSSGSSNPGLDWCGCYKTFTEGWTPACSSFKND